jgi:hypothetical protein
MALTDPDTTSPQPPTVAKTRVFELIERLSGNRELLERSVTALRAGGSLLDVGVLSGAIEGDAKRKAHLEEHWIGGERAQRVLGQALLRAGELALERRLPVDAYWVFAGRRLEAAVCHNERQVTLIVVTPYPSNGGMKLLQPRPYIEIFV